MEHHFYMPILKSKAGEFRALQSLSNDIRNKIVPLIEVTQMEWDNEENEKPKTIEQHLEKFCKKIVKSCALNTWFLDTEYINSTRPDGFYPIEYLYAKLKEYQIYPIPIVKINSSGEYLKSVKDVIAAYKFEGIGLRFSIEDLIDSDRNTKLDLILKQLKVQPKKCHFIIDLAQARFQQLEELCEAILEELDFFPYLTDWTSITVASGSFPPSGSIQTGINTIKRSDWVLYKMLLEKLKSATIKSPNFGDYGIVAPGHFEFDPKRMSASANIRYTSKDEWLVVKGTSLKKKNGHQQYFAQAQSIVNSGRFLNEKFSPGDQYIADCARGTKGPGNPPKWTWAGHIHHFCHVVDDLSAIHPFF